MGVEGHDHTGAKKWPDVRRRPHLYGGMNARAALAGGPDSPGRTSSAGATELAGVDAGDRAGGAFRLHERRDVGDVAAPSTALGLLDLVDFEVAERFAVELELAFHGFFPWRSAGEPISPVDREDVWRAHRY